MLLGRDLGVDREGDVELVRTDLERRELVALRGLGLGLGLELVALRGLGLGLGLELVALRGCAWGVGLG